MSFLASTVFHPLVTKLGSVKLNNEDLQPRFDSEASKMKPLTEDEKKAGWLWEVVEYLPFTSSSGVVYGGTFRISRSSKEERESDDNATDGLFSLLDFH